MNLLPFLVPVLLFFSQLVLTQDHEIGFSTYPRLTSLRPCLQSSLKERFGMLDHYSQCETISCLCEPPNIEIYKPYVYEQAQQYCGGTTEAERATAVVDEYCDLHGFTRRITQPSSTTDTSSGMFMLGPGTYELRLIVFQRSYHDATRCVYSDCYCY